MVATASTAPSSKPVPWARWVLAGPLVFVCAGLIMGGGALWLPGGAAGVDNLVWPIVLFPAIWTALFLYACLDRRLLRAYVIVGALLAVHLALLAHHFSR